jgi:hypothetical protein
MGAGMKRLILILVFAVGLGLLMILGAKMQGPPPRPVKLILVA